MNSLFSTPKKVKQAKQGRNNNQTNKTSSLTTATKFQFSPQVLISATATRNQTPGFGIVTPRTSLFEFTKARSAANLFTPTTTNKQAVPEECTTSILGKRRLPMNMVVSQVAHRGPKSPVRVLRERMFSRVKSERPPPDPAVEQILNSIKGRQAGKLPHPRELMSARMRKYRRMEGPEDEISKAYTSIYGDDATNKLRLGYQRKDTESVTPARTNPHSSSYADFVRSSQIKLDGVPDKQTTSPEAAVVPTIEEPRWLGGDAEHETQETNIVSPGEILTSQSFLQTRLQSQSSQWNKYLDESASFVRPGSSPELVRGEQESDKAPESARCHWLYEEEENPRREITTKKCQREDNSLEHLPGMVYGKMAARVNYADDVLPMMPRFLYRREPDSPCKERDDDFIHTISP